MTKHHYVRNDAILASSPGPILKFVEQDFQTRFSRDFFRLKAEEKKAFNVYEESVVGSSVDDEFHVSTDSGPVWNGEQVTRTIGNQLRDLDEIKALLRTRLSAVFARKRDEGVQVALGQNVVVIDTSMDAQQEVTSLVKRLERVGGSQNVRTRSGATVDADLAIAQTIFNAVEDHVAGVWSNDALLGSAIDAATTVTQLQEIDLESGW